MGILIPTQTLTGPQNPLVGALTGLTQGLSQGIPIAEQMLRRKEESERQNAELALQQQQIGRRNEREDASKRAASLLMRAAAMNAGAASPGLGVSSPPGQGAGSAAPALPSVGQAEEQGPGTAGKPLQGPPEGTQQGQQSFGSPGTDFLHSVLSNPNMGFSMEDAEKILAAHHYDQSIAAVAQHQGRISDTIQRGLDKGAYDAVDVQGHPDQSATIEMQGMLQRIQSLDRTDPRAAAALLDHAEEVEKNARQYKSQQMTAFQNRQRKVTALQQEVDQRAAAGWAMGIPDRGAEETQALLNDLQNGNIDEKTFDAQLPDARQGLLGMKAQYQKALIERAQAEADRDRAIAAYNERRQAPQPSFRNTEAGVEKEHQNRMAEEEAKAKLHIAQQPHPRNPAEPLEATQGIEDQLKEQFGSRPEDGHTTHRLLGKDWTAADEDKYQAVRAKLFKNAHLDDPQKIEPDVGANEAQGGQTDSAAAIINDKTASKAEKIKRAQALGFKSYAEVEAAAKGGK